MMNKNSVTGIAIGLIVAVVVIGYFLATRGNTSQTMSEENKATISETTMNQGELATDFELVDTSGSVVKLSDLKGQKVYIKFWASWCSICLAGLEDVDTLAAEDNGFKVFSIVSPGFKGEQSTERFKEWFKGVEVKNLTVLLDENGTIASAYGLRAYPTSAYIGSDGVLVKTVVGHQDNETIKKTFEFIK